jgi:hypothetical protein
MPSRSIIQYLIPRIEPKKLKLYLVCDSADIQSTGDIAGPLLQLPPLKDCTIRFGRIHCRSYSKETKRQFQQLAANTAIWLTGRLNVQPFRFLDLPQEIQLKILGFTDLVTPYDIQWIGKRF